MIVSSFKQALKSAPKVLKDTTVYFGIYFFVFSFLSLALFKNFFESSLMSGFLNQILLFISSLFTVFIIPYYAFKYSQGSVPKFRDFIRDNIWLVVLNHIKAFFVILLFLLLLILPGIYKALRFSFLTETVLFDKQKRLLKQADQNTRRFFWKIVLFFIIAGLFSFILGWILKAGLFFLGSNFFIDWLNLIWLFFLQCFYLLWKINLFFEIKKQKGESISC